MLNWTLNPNRLSDLSSVQMSAILNALYGVPLKPRIYLSVLLHTVCQLNKSFEPYSTCTTCPDLKYPR